MKLEHQWRAFRTIFAREVRRFTRIWLQTILPPVITVTLYFVIFGALIGPRIGEMGGFSYMEFVAPGLIMMSVITNSYSNVVSSFYSQKFQRSVEEMLVSPVPNYVILAGYVAGGMARGLSVGLVVTLMSLVFTKLALHSIFITVSIVMMTSLLFSMAGFINAVFAQSFDDISIIPTFVLTPLTYLGGVFYSVSLLSEFWQTVSLLNPVLYMVNAFRFGFLGVSDISVWVAFVMIAIFSVILFFYCLYLMNHSNKLRT